jgi:hypothetical protein
MDPPPPPPAPNISPSSLSTNITGEGGRDELYGAFGTTVPGLGLVANGGYYLRLPMQKKNWKSPIVEAMAKAEVYYWIWALFFLVLHLKSTRCSFEWLFYSELLCWRVAFFFHNYI